MYSLLELRSSESVATSRNVEEIRDYLNCDSLSYLSLDGLQQSVDLTCGGFCTACFTGEYPITVEKKIGKYQHENNHG